MIHRMSRAVFCKRGRIENCRIGVLITYTSSSGEPMDGRRLCFSHS